jgi:hypothetical protein
MTRKQAIALHCYTFKLNSPAIELSQFQGKISINKTEQN